MINASTLIENILSGIINLWYLIPLIFLIAYLKKLKPKKKTKFKTKKLKPKKQLTRIEKKQKGDEYEKYISEYFKKQGWTTWEHGLEKGYKDEGIDLFLKKEKNYIFVQCKNWNNNHSYKMGKEQIINYREKAKKYMLKNPQISKIIINLEYKIKLIFISPNDIYTREAKKYIKENQDLIEYKIIPMQI